MAAVTFRFGLCTIGCCLAIECIDESVVDAYTTSREDQGGDSLLFEQSQSTEVAPCRAPEYHSRMQG